MNYEVIDEVAGNENKDLLKRCAEETVKKFNAGKEVNLSIVLVSIEKIRELNEKYYNKKGSTDVLTFTSDEEDYLGDIIICPSFVREKAKEDKFEWELCHVVVHGTMHLLGIHHEGKNEDEQGKQHKKEIQIINKVLKLS